MTDEGLWPDVLVVGGGPVGLMAALYATRAGFSVCVVEPRADPIDKACGEGLMPTALAALHGVGVDPAGHDFTGIRYLDAVGTTTATATFDGVVGRGVRRTELQRALSARVTELGVELCRGRVVDLVPGPEPEVRLASGACLRPQWVLAADGLHSPARRRLGLTPTRARRGPRYGLRAHFALSPWSDHVEVTWGDTAEAYVTPVADDLVGVALLGPRRGGSFRERLDQFPALLERLGTAQQIGTVAGAGPLWQPVTSLVCERTLFVGDAAGYLDALTGEGLALGFTSARLAIDCVVRHHPERYPARWRAASRRTRWLTEGMVAAAGTARVRPLVVPIAAHVPGVFSRAVRALA
jgi:flavin-dependent dehydrogenase